MQRLRYKIKTKAPILIADNVKNTNIIMTSEFIPGSAILGMLAGSYIKSKSLIDAHRTDQFYDWFLNNKLLFSNAYVVTKDKDDEFINFPIPFSIKELKNEKEIVYDLLYYETTEQTKAVPGFGRLENDKILKQKVAKNLNFHHKHDPETRRPESEKFFNYETISKNQVFEGQIVGEKEYLQHFLQAFDKKQKGYLGRSKNTQYGEVTFEICSDQPEEFNSDIKNWNVKSSGNVSLTFLSNTIIYNEYGYSITDRNELRNYLSDVLETNVQIQKAFIKSRDVENFISVWRLRKPSESCFLAGSCFVLEIENADQKNLIKLQQEGIGERRGEGFGRIVFGWQGSKEKIIKDDNEYVEKYKKPGENKDLPIMTKNILKKIIQDYVLKGIEVRAISEARKFIKEKDQNKGLPSKTFIGRLELAVNKKKDHASLKTELDKINKRKPAHDKFVKCDNKNKNLFQFLNDLDLKNEITQALRGTTKLEEMCNEIEFNLATDEQFQQRVYKNYFLSFLSFLRWTLKKA